MKLGPAVKAVELELEMQCFVEGRRGEALLLVGLEEVLEVAVAFVEAVEAEVDCRDFAAVAEVRKDFERGHKDSTGVVFAEVEGPFLVHFVKECC